ncbi:MAG: polyprenyl synthetase family protein [Clostridia bacterium]|nr:polyprenyl synthetase family protein [Clostridia bacterium]
MSIEEKLKEYNVKVNARLGELLSNYDPDYPVITEAMGYSVKNGGKRIRPFMTLLFSELCGADRFDSRALDFACALECVHTYSLIHDDLPCMDNDDLRRGKPTNHKVFGDATATLAGDGLLTYAFEIIADSGATDKAKVAAVKALSELAGYKGMVGGQVMDMIGESKRLDRREYEKMNALKTGALLRCTARLGLSAAGCEDEETYRLCDEYCACVGWAFQIRDDILDVIADQNEFGKPVGSDEKNGKTTVLSYMTLEEAQDLAAQLTNKAISALEKFGDRAADLCELADFLLQRRK